METIHGFDFVALDFDENGSAKNPTQVSDLNKHVKKEKVTDTIFIAHGFRNDLADAKDLYTEFLKNLRTHLQRPEFAQVAGRRFVVAGIFWPSKTFKESFGQDEGSIQSAEEEDAAVEKQRVRQQLERMKATEANDEEKKKNIDRAIGLLDSVEDNPRAQDEFVKLVLTLLKDVKVEPAEGLERIRTKRGSELLDALDDSLILPTDDSDSDGGTVTSVEDAFDDGNEGQAQGFTSFFGSIFGKIGQFLNLTSWYTMKDRSGNVGTNGVAKAVRDLRGTVDSVKIHLVGHSLGGRLMAACAKKLAEGTPEPVDSLTLLQAAFSQYGLSRTLNGEAGFFDAIVKGKIVRGPLILTYSKSDMVVGKAYAIASRLAGDNKKAIGDENDEFGGIGRNGAQNAQNSLVERLHTAGQKYDFKPAVINNLNGSNGLITSHGDVRNPDVTYAFASVLAKT